MHHARWAAAAFVATLFSPAIASASPVVPGANSPCASNFVGAMTWLPNDKMPMECVDQLGSGPRWQPVTSPYPISDRWVTYGLAMKLHGEGLRNASIKSGDWTATPQDADTKCRAEQLTVVNAGVVSQPQVDEGGPGQPLSFRVLPQLFSITMSGYCLWVKAGA
jgi:hypothetical protein